ncbi:hypothetical protein [Shigella phage ESh2]|nr:hypothetical protein [Shigella phage ESh2]
MIKVSLYGQQQGIVRYGLYVVSLGMVFMFKL